MTYHDNEVSLLLSEGYSMINGSYTINSFSVTQGQDPDGYIHAGLTASFGSNGQMSFHAGRQGSAATANWFNTAVAASQTTFNHTAGELNFAFSGTLKMTITGGILGNGQDTFTFSNVALAQGHTGASNNWWFGGLNCSYIQNDEVACTGINSKGDEVSFVFLRGGNDVSTILATPSRLIETTAWMRRVKGSLTLDELVMPGSHDAGMSELHHCNPAGFSDPYTQTQSGNIGRQLMDGSRYFDIRVDYDYEELVTYHRTGPHGCNGQDLKSVLDEVVKFLGEYHTETAILKFSHIRDDGDDHNPAVIKSKINALLTNYRNVIYTNKNPDVNLAKVTLAEARGKMILVFDYVEFIDPAVGHFHYADGSSAQPGFNITVFDEYSNTDDYDTMEADQLQKWNANAGLGRGHFFLLSWTLTPKFAGHGVEHLAGEANPKLPEVLYSRIITRKAQKPNIVYIDFVNNQTAQSIIMYNL
jgi:hypothetical protein